MGRPRARSWTWARAAAVACGGALGASLRWGVVEAVPIADGFPWAVLLVNVVGSGAFGVLLALEALHPERRALVYDGAALGFCGGLTTFSTFAVEVADLMRTEQVWTAGAYLVASTVLSIAAVVVGASAFRQRRALRLSTDEPV